MMNRTGWVWKLGVVAAMGLGPSLTSASVWADEPSMSGRSPSRVEAPQGQARQQAGREGGLSDAEIFALLEVANMSDIETGQLGQMKAKHPRVQQFGHRMVQEHLGMLNAGAETALHLHVVPEKPGDAKKMMQEHKQKLGELANKSGAEFDRAYLEHEVTMHQKVLDKIDSALRATDRTEVKQLLEKSRQHVEAHLRSAQELKRQVSS